MAQMCFDIPAAEVTRVTNAMAARFGYQATINGSPNPQNKTEFTRQLVIRWVKDQVKAYEGSQAGVSATATAEASAEAINIT